MSEAIALHLRQDRAPLCRARDRVKLFLPRLGFFFLFLRRCGALESAEAIARSCKRYRAAAVTDSAFFFLRWWFVEPSLTWVFATDKICDQVSDAVLDACLAADPSAKVACETAAKTGMIMVFGEITTSAILDFQRIVRGVIKVRRREKKRRRREEGG